MPSLEERLAKLERVFNLGGIGAPGGGDMIEILERHSKILGSLLQDQYLGGVYGGPLRLPFDNILAGTLTVTGRLGVGGSIEFGSTPAVMNLTGLHFKDTSYGDGIFWDGLAKKVSIRGLTSANEALLLIRAEGTETVQVTLSPGSGLVSFNAGGNQTGSFSRFTQGLDTDKTTLALRYRPGTGAEVFDQVEVGVTDSGDSGFRVLQVPN